MIDKNSQWFPYIRVQDNYYDLSGSEKIPRQICDYLLDAPQRDYTPKDDNTYARCKLWKYLYYDGTEPLKNPLPTIDQKMSVLFNPQQPENPPTDKGYRLIPQYYVKQSQTDAQTRIFVYMGRTLPANDEEKIALAVSFRIWTHYTYESNTKDDCYSRAFAIEQALVQAFHGVAMSGVGTFFFSRAKHPDCGSRNISDGNTNIGRELTMALELVSNETNGDTTVENMPSFTSDGRVRFV